MLENDHYIVINKPPHVASLNERDSTRATVIELARDYCADAQLCHRLDKETSGVLAIAKNPAAYRHLSLQFEHREVGKIYHAISGGLHHFDDVVVNLPLAASAKGIARIDRLEGKPSETLIKTIRTFQKHTLVKCLPFTGRLHQIRVHLASLKAPIVADTLYGGAHVYLSELKRRFNLKRDTDEQPLIQRVALHAAELHFRDLDGTEIRAEAPYPKDFRALITQLEKNL